MSEHHQPDTNEIFGLEGSRDVVHTQRAVTDVHDHHDEDGSNDHLALIYESQTDQFAAVIPFIRQGLERGERCLYVADDNTKEEVHDALVESGINAEAAIASGALSIHTKEDTYLRTEEFEQDAMLDFWQETLAEAQDDEGYTGIRAAAEMTWALDEDTGLDQLVQYEAMLNTIYPDEDYVVLCQYNRERFPSEILSDVIRSHPLMVYDSTVCQNFYYHSPDEFFDADHSSMDVDRTVEGLVSRARTRHQLKERERYQRELYDITSNPDLSFDEKLQTLFDLGCEFFDLELGGMARVDPATNLFEVEAISDDHDHLVPGAKVALSETYCRLVADGGETVAGIADPANSSFEGTKACEEFGVNAYLGTSIELDGALNRTLFFVSSEPRQAPFTEGERTFHRLMGEWIEYELKQQQRENQLTALNTLSRKVMQAETQSKVSQTVIQEAERTLDLSTMAIAVYDKQQGKLVPVATTDAAEEVLEATCPYEGDDGLGWTAFIEGEIRRETVAFEGQAASASHYVSELIAVPLAKYGVLIAGSTVSDGFSPNMYEVVETVAATTERALDRAHREQQLHDREEVLKEKNATLDRLNRVNDIIRSIAQGLVQASTRTEIEAVVCEQLADVGLYELAWIGEQEPVTAEITPCERAGRERGYFEDLTITTDEADEGYDPIGRAIKTREPQVVNNLLDNQPVTRWQRTALNRGYHAIIALPLIYEDTLYGVLNIYAGQPNVFDELEQAVLAELSDTIAYAINTVENKKALVSDDATELEFAVQDETHPLVQLTKRADCEVTLESLVPQKKSGLHAFITTRGVSADEVINAHRPGVASELTLVSEFEEDDNPTCLFDVVLADESISQTALEHGGVVRQITAVDGIARFIIELASDAATRKFVETVQTKYPDTELVAHRTREHAPQTRLGFYERLLDSLTDRQLEILHTAYVSGYFEEPRTRTGSGLASLLGISQPTFNSHLRAALRKICHQLLEDTTLLNPAATEKRGT